MSEGALPCAEWPLTRPATYTVPIPSNTSYSRSSPRVGCQHMPARLASGATTECRWSRHTTHGSRIRVEWHATGRATSMLPTSATTRSGRLTQTGTSASWLATRLASLDSLTGMCGSRGISQPSRDQVRHHPVWVIWPCSAAPMTWRLTRLGTSGWLTPRTTPSGS
jgi:hypothetical protein